MIRLVDLKKGDLVFRCYENVWSTRLVIIKEQHSYSDNSCVLAEYAEQFGIHPKGEIKELDSKDKSRLFRTESEMLEYQKIWENEVFNLTHFELTQLLFSRVKDSLSEEDKIAYSIAVEQFREEY